MLSFIYVSSPEIIKEKIDQFDPQSTTWIVSDLKSKLDIQEQCINKYGYYIDDSIMRMSDFWKMWLKRLDPKMSIVSDEFIKNYTQDYIAQNSDVISVAANQSSTVYKYIKQLAPVIFNKHHQAVFEEWSKNMSPDQLNWISLAQSCLQKLIYTDKVISHSWLASYIQLLDLNRIIWSKKIIFDLSSEMTTTEFGIILALSKKTDVEIIIPDPKWKSKYKYLLNTYEVNQGFADKKQHLLKSETQKNDNNVNQFLRFQTQVLECKFIIQQVRQWLDQGVLPTQISIVSPQLEKYWPILSIHFDVEGIPVNKSLVSHLNTLKPFQRLLSKVKSTSASVTWESLEQDYYSQKNNSIESHFEKFKSLFIEIIDDDDLQRDIKIKELYYKKTSQHTKQDRLSFVSWLFKIGHSIFVDQADIDIFMLSIKSFLETTKDLNLLLDSWMNIYADNLSKKELTLLPAQKMGIDVRSLQNASIFNSEYIIWFGLDESAFTGHQSHVLTVDQMDELKYLFDFSFDYPEESHTEFGLRWLGLNNFKCQIYTCSKYSFKSEPLNTSLFFIEHKQDPDFDFSSVRQPTRLDQLLFSFNNQYLSKDLKIQYKPHQLSISDIIQYDQCGFKLLASKGFRLKDYAPISLELDPRQKGNLAHALFEYLITDQRYLNYNANEITKFLSDLRSRYHLFPQADEFWFAQLKKYLLLAEKFCLLEAHRLKNLNAENILEKDVEYKTDSLTITGRIDRLDIYSKDVIVYDYKSSSSHINYGLNWISKKEYQMLFYLLTLQSVFPDKNIEGALYLVYKDMTVSKGLIRDGFKLLQQIFTSELNKSVVEGEEFQRMLDDFKDVLKNIDEKIQQGLYAAKPYDDKVCSQCFWNKICRAEHL